jgi:hypothetical protein
MNKENILNSKHHNYELASTFKFDNDSNVYKGFIGETSSEDYCSVNVFKDQYITADKINLVSDSILQKDIDLQLQTSKTENDNNAISFELHKHN